jgi:hypothetical protein
LKKADLLNQQKKSADLSIIAFFKVKPAKPKMLFLPEAPKPKNFIFGWTRFRVRVPLVEKFALEVVH